MKIEKVELFYKDVPCRFEDGYIYPPEGPGLGVDVEDERLYREWSQF